jgi:hypothetical protein
MEGQLYPQGKEHLVPTGRRLNGPQSWSGCYKEEKNLALLGTKPRHPFSMFNILIYSNSLRVLYWI